MIRWNRTVGLLAIGAMMIGTACSSDRGGQDQVAREPGAETSSTLPSTPDPSTEGPETAADTPTTGPNPSTSASAIAADRLDAVQVGDAADFGSGLVVSVVDVEPADLEAELAGETSGPGVLVHIDMRNDTDAPVDLSLLTVTVTGPDGEPGRPVVIGDVETLHGELAAGAEASGAFGFRLNGSRAGLLVEIVHAAQVNVIVVQT